MDLRPHNLQNKTKQNTNRWAKEERSKQRNKFKNKNKNKKTLFPFSNQQNNKKEKVEKSPRIYDHVSMGTLAENQVCNPKPWEI